MRAERLLRLVSLLRQHGRMSAARLARRLEVSPRTVMRDIDALALAGVPVFAERGSAGGYSLLPGYRPDVEELAAEEVRALFVAGGTPVAEALGLGEEFSRALRKLAVGLPGEEQQRIGWMLERIVIDPGGWGQLPPVTPEAMGVVFRAVQEEVRVRLVYRSRGAQESATRTVDPWGLVLAGDTWYLVAAHRGRPRTYRLDRILKVTTLPAPARRPERLDLGLLWHDLRAAWHERPSSRVVIRVVTAQANLALRQLRLTLLGQPQVSDEGDGWMRIEAKVNSLRGVVGVLLGFGDWVEALEPPELRHLMVKIAQQACRVYGATAETAPHPSQAQADL